MDHTARTFPKKNKIKIIANANANLLPGNITEKLISIAVKCKVCSTLAPMLAPMLASMLASMSATRAYNYLALSVKQGLQTKHRSCIRNS